MLDQASELRKLVLRSVRQQVTAAGPAPRLIVIAAGRDGVGATTMAVNLSVALADHGSRVVTVDADIHRAGIAELCGLAAADNSGDLSLARRDIHEVLQRGPAGIQIVPGLSSLGSDADWNETAQQRLLRQLSRLGRHADIVVLDVGAGEEGFLKHCCLSADHVLLVTTTDSDAVMDTYACVKSSLSDLEPHRLELIVNGCDESAAGRDVHTRIDQSCRRFLGHSVDLVAIVPRDAAVTRAATQSVPFVISSSNCPAARAVNDLADAIRGGGRSSESARDAA